MGNWLFSFFERRASVATEHGPVEFYYLQPLGIRISSLFRHAPIVTICNEFIHPCVRFFAKPFEQIEL